MMKDLNRNMHQKFINEIAPNYATETVRYISRYIILFAIATGTRFSEILGLTWECVDLVNQTVTINKTWDAKYKNDFSDTKNYSSKRTITIDKETRDLLSILKHEQKVLAAKTGLRNKKNLCFINSKFELVTNNAVNKTLKSLCHKVGIKEITCHGLRHTHASMLLYQGINVRYISRHLVIMISLLLYKLIAIY
nr:site-specific integrase [Cytobacillus solani]